MEDKILIIDFEDAQNGVLKDIPLKDEIATINGMFATCQIPVEGAAPLNGFKEEGQFKQGLLSVTLNNNGTTYSLPINFMGVQGRVPEEEPLYDYNKQTGFSPLPVSVVVKPNSSIRVKYEDNLSGHRYKHNIKLFITYTEK